MKGEEPGRENQPFRGEQADGRVVQQGQKGGEPKGRRRGTYPEPVEQDPLGRIAHAIRLPLAVRPHCRARAAQVATSRRRNTIHAAASGKAAKSAETQSARTIASPAFGV